MAKSTERREAVAPSEDDRRRVREALDRMLDVPVQGVFSRAWIEDFGEPEAAQELERVLGSITTDPAEQQVLLGEALDEYTAEHPSPEEERSRQVVNTEEGPVVIEAAPEWDRKVDLIDEGLKAHDQGPVSFGRWIRKRIGRDPTPDVSAAVLSVLLGNEPATARPTDELRPDGTWKGRPIRSPRGDGESRSRSGSIGIRD